MNPANYSKSAMRKMLDVLPIGTIKDVSEKLELPYTTVQNCIHGKQFIESVVNEIEERFEAVKKSLREE